MGLLAPSSYTAHWWISISWMEAGQFQA